MVSGDRPDALRKVIPIPYFLIRNIHITLRFLILFGPTGDGGATLPSHRAQESARAALCRPGPDAQEEFGEGHGVLLFICFIGLLWTPPSYSALAFSNPPPPQANSKHVSMDAFVRNSTVFLGPVLTKRIDDFIANWRPLLVQKLLEFKGLGFRV